MLTVVLMMLSISLTAQNTNNKDVWLNKKGNVEMTPETAIDNSKILSDWVRQSDSLKVREDQLRQKDEIIQAMIIKVAEMTGELKAANTYIANQTEKVDDINEEQIKVAKGLFTNFSMEFRLHGNLTGYEVYQNKHVRDKIWEHIRSDAIVRYNIKKFYIFVQGTLGTDNYGYASFGGGYRLW